jgi:hypothetical protein
MTVWTYDLVDTIIEIFKKAAENMPTQYFMRRKARSLTA